MIQSSLTPSEEDTYIHDRNKITLRVVSPFCLRASWAGPLREQRGPGEKLSHAKFYSRRGQLINGVGSTCLHTSKSLSNHESVTGYYWLFYPANVHSLSPDNVIERERKRNSAKMQPRKVEIKSLMGPLFQKKSLGASGKYPLFLPPPGPAHGSSSLQSLCHQKY